MDSLKYKGWQIEGGLGIGSMNQFSDSKLNVILIMNYEFEFVVLLLGSTPDSTLVSDYDEHVTPVYNFNFGRTFDERSNIVLGCNYSEGNYWYQRVDGIEYYEKVRFISPYFGIYFHWVSKEDFRVKSGFNLAISFSKRDGNNPYVFTNGKESELAYHADLVKLEFGKRVAGTIAFGYGVKGIFRGGLQYNF